jgi:hypothetical protein
MKTIIGLLTATLLVAGASSAMATEFQASDEAVNYELSHAAGSSFGGAYNSARVPGGVHNSTWSAPTPIEDFQAVGKN